MCLDTVDKKVTIKEGTGWKFFAERGGRLASAYYGNKHPAGEWITDTATEPIEINRGFDLNLRQTYPTGFHIFVGKPQFSQVYGLPVHQVRFRDVVAQGVQEFQLKGATRSLNVVVAREMFIERKEKCQQGTPQ